MTADAHAARDPAGAPPVSVHFVNNVLAAAASYIDEDPELARDVLAELGQFLSHRLRDAPAGVSVSEELAHTAIYLRLQQARFPGRITTRLPDAIADAGRVPPGAIQAPLAEALARRLREHAGGCVVALRGLATGFELELRGPEDGAVERLAIPLPREVPA